MRKTYMLTALLCALFFINGCSYLNPFNWFGDDPQPQAQTDISVEKVEKKPTTIKAKSSRFKVVPDSMTTSVESLGTKYKLYTIPVRVDSGDVVLREGKLGVKSFRKNIFLLREGKEILFYTFKKDQKKVWVILNFPMKRIFVLDKQTKVLEIYNLEGQKVEWEKVEKTSVYHLNNGIFIVPDEKSVLAHDPARKSWIYTAP